MSYNFNEMSFQKGTKVQGQTAELVQEELILRNTFINAQTGPFPRPTPGTVADKDHLIKWVDLASRSKIPLAREGNA